VTGSTCRDLHLDADDVTIIRPVAQFIAAPFIMPSHRSRDPKTGAPCGGR